MKKEADKAQIEIEECLKKQKLELAEKLNPPPEQVPDGLAAAAQEDLITAADSDSPSFTLRRLLLWEMPKYL